MGKQGSTMIEQPKTLTRRGFFHQAACASTAFLLAAPRVLGREKNSSPSDKLDLAIVGAGGRGGDTIGEFAKENIVALCDVDDKRAEKSYNRFDKVPHYRDFRVLLDKHPAIDAVVVSTPDHTHAVIALAAIQRNKHVYVEKPLAHNIHDVRRLMQAANEQGVQTQLGNQGHSYDDIRLVREWIQDGALGTVREVHCWYTQPYGDGTSRPSDTPPVPDTLDWDLWLGPAAVRPYHPAYVPAKWRSWAAFGTGVLGDWVCHILDPAYWALDLTAPTKILARNEGRAYSPERFPLISTIQYDFPARGNGPPVKVIWTYGQFPDIPQLKEVQLDDWNRKAGAILIGEKGCLVHGSHGGSNPRILPASRNREYQRPPETIPRVPGGHPQDWIRACKDGQPAGSNFNYGGPLTEVALLGVIATVFNDETLEWDSTNARFTNHEKANGYLQEACREGWG